MKDETKGKIIECELKRLNEVINKLEIKYNQLDHRFMSHRDNSGIHIREGGCLE